MSNFIAKISVLNPVFLVKLIAVNMLIRRLRTAGDIHILGIDYSGKEPVLTVRVDDATTVYNAGIERGIIIQRNGWVFHESMIGSVKLCWLECPRWEAVLDAKIREAHL